MYIIKNTTFRKAIVWAILLFLVQCSGNNQVSEEELPPGVSTLLLSERDALSSGITVGVAGQQTIFDEVLANGAIDVPPQNLAVVSAPMAGYVRSLKVMPGTHVHKGEVICELENIEFVQIQLDYLVAVNKRNLAQTEYQRQTELYQENVNALRDLQFAKSELEILQAQERSLFLKLKYLGIDPHAITPSNIRSRIQIVSPIHGNVKHVQASLGKYVNISDPLLEILDNSHMHLELRVFEKDILKVATNQKITFQVPAVSNETFQGYVFLIGKNFDPNTKTVLVHGHMMHEDKKKLIPGMYVTAQITTQSKTCTVIPEDAVVRQKDTYYYFAAQKTSSGFKFEQKPLPDGYIRNNQWITNQSIKDSIVLSGAYYIHAELRKTPE